MASLGRRFRISIGGIFLPPTTMHVAILSASPSDVTIDKLAWVADGFTEAGHEVRRVHDLASLRAVDSWAELVVLDQHGAGVNHNSLATMAREPRHAKWVYWWRDTICQEKDRPLAKQDHITTFGKIMRAVDFTLVKEAGLLDEYKALGINAAFVDQACPADMPAVNYPETPQWDVLIVGNTSDSYGQRHRDAKACVAAGLSVMWCGHAGSTVPAGVEALPFQHPLHELPGLVSKCGVVLGVDYRDDLEGYTSDRTWLLAGMGAVYLLRRPEGHGYHFCLSYGARSGWADDIKTLVANREAREQIGTIARDYVMTEQTYRDRASQIVSLIS